MLDHQIEFSKCIAEIYKPISGSISDPESIKAEGNPEGIRACEEYENIVNDIKLSLQPELEMIETRIIRPADELMEVIKVIRKTALKRDHKQLDYDRERAALKKIQDKKDRTLKDEKALYKAEADAEVATQEFNHYNDLLKTELPKLFALEREFIQPLFQSFYYMQLNVFYTLHERMQGINIGYFDLTLDVEAAFEKKRDGVQERAEALSIVRFRVTSLRASKPDLKLTAAGSKSDTGSVTSRRTSSLDMARPATGSGTDTPPPPYTSTGLPASSSNSLLTPAATTGVGRSNSTGTNYSVVGKKAPPPPRPKPKTLSVEPEKATALYDFEAQAEGDLSFSAGDVIEIMQRSSNENEWWIGKLNGRQGQFPGNYVKLG